MTKDQAHKTIRLHQIENSARFDEIMSQILEMKEDYEHLAKQYAIRGAKMKTMFDWIKGDRKVQFLDIAQWFDDDGIPL